ncbi:polymorphic toxin-type HINT domain-containing protein [Actinoplanes octamycinicus]
MGTKPQSSDCVSNSFVAGTPVLMADGTTKPIEQIQPGDRVMAGTPNSTRLTPEPVSATIVGNGDKNLVDIDVETADGTPTTITATDGYPFWTDDDGSPQTPGGDWINAAELRQGSWLKTSTGTLVRVAGAHAHAQHAKVYNLTVENLQTYYVLAANEPVLVHNCVAGKAGGHDIVEDQDCVHVCLGVNPYSDRLAARLGSHTFNGNPWGSANAASGSPLWMEGVSRVVRNGRIRLSITLDDLFGEDGRNPADSAQEAFEVNYARGSQMDRVSGCMGGNQTAWEIGEVGKAVIFGHRDWESIDWYWGGGRVDVANPFGG